MLLPGNCTSLDAARREGREESLRRKDTFSLGTKKRNGRSPARWRKVGRSQALTEAKETLRAIAAPAIPVRSDVLLDSAWLPPTGLLSSLLFSSLLLHTVARTPLSLLLSSSLRTDRSRKIITDGWSFNRKALGRATSGTWRLFFIQELCNDCVLTVHCLKKMDENPLNSLTSLPPSPWSPRVCRNYWWYNRINNTDN